MAGGLHPPLEVIASWPLNYTSFETGGHYVVYVVASLLVIAYIAVVMRTYARIFLSKSFGIDDGLIVLNLVPLTLLAVGVILAITEYGFDRHVWNAPTDLLVKARKISLVNEGTYMISTCMTKISILLFYRRLQKGSVSPFFLYCVYAAIGSVVAYFLVFSVAMAVMCRPLSTYWKMVDYVWYMNHKDLHNCLEEDKWLIASAAISAVQDFVACGLPSLLLWKLKLPRRQKIALCSVFAFGFFLSVCAVLRTVYIYRTYYTTYDMLWESQPAWLWLSIEAEMAVVCASAPALKVFFNSILDSTLASRSHGYSDSSPSQSTVTTKGGHKARAFGKRSEKAGGIKQQIEFSVDSESHLGGVSPRPWDAPPSYDKYGQQVESEKEAEIELRPLQMPLPGQNYRFEESHTTVQLDAFGRRSVHVEYGYGFGFGHASRSDARVASRAETFLDDGDSVEEVLCSPEKAKKKGR